MKCPRCGAEIAAGAQFCVKCGSQINQIQQAGGASQQQYPQQNYMPQENPSSQQNKKSKTGRIIIVLLAAVFLIMGIIVFALMIGDLTGKDSKQTKSEHVSNREDEDREKDTAKGKEPETVTKEEQENREESIPEVTEAPSQVVEPEAEKLKHTIMIYMVGSDLETNNRYGSFDIQEIFNSDYGDDTRVVLQTGGCLDWYFDGMGDGKVERWEFHKDTMKLVESLGKTRMLTADALEDFISFAAEEYPAEKYTLVMWDHGGGIPIGFGKDEIYPNDKLYDFQIREALANAGVYFEGIIFDACNMCTLEVAMSIKDYAKYMVAAESYVEGVGMDYFRWMNCYGKEDTELSDSYEVIATSYMDSLEKIKGVGSISVIDLGKIQSVYDAYVAYIASVHDDILNAGYMNYALARDNCGVYQYTDSVDLMTLATEYPTEASAQLMNATVNAVCYTESDYAYGHGLAVYSPCDYLGRYEEARYDMEVMGYDADILDFYDDVVSVRLSYMGTYFVKKYAGEWFNEELAYEYTGEDYEPGKYIIDTVQMDGYLAIPLTENDWRVVSNVAITSFYMDESGKYAYILGRDNMYRKDANGYIVVEKPQKWAYVFGRPVCFVSLDYWSDKNTGEWTQTGGIVARCNGTSIMIVVHYDNAHPEGVIQGYVLYDFISEEGDMRIREFTENDIIDIVVPYFDILSEDGELGLNYVKLDSFNASELEVSYGNINLSGRVAGVSYEITDVYGNVYSTEDIVFE